MEHQLSSIAKRAHETSHHDVVLTLTFGGQQETILQLLEEISRLGGFAVLDTTFTQNTGNEPLVSTHF